MFLNTETAANRKKTTKHTRTRAHAHTRTRVHANWAHSLRALRALRACVTRRPCNCQKNGNVQFPQLPIDCGAALLRMFRFRTTLVLRIARRPCEVQRVR